MKSAEGRGRTLDEAVDAALIQLGESRRNVDVRVLSETPEETVVEVSVIGAGPAPVAAGAAPGAGATPVADADELGAGEDARLVVAKLLGHMGITAQVSVRSAAQGTIILDVTGRDLGMLIGWRGETLRALQTITNLLVSRQIGPDRRVIVDVERYRQRREHTVR